jgi:hypothetical protein
MAHSAGLCSPHPGIRTIVLAVLCLAVLPPSLPAQQIIRGDSGPQIDSPLILRDETQSPGTIWSMRAQDQFSVSVSIDKRTEIELDGQTPVVTATNDRLELEYRVLRVLRDRQCDMIVICRNAVREVRDSQSEPSIQKLQTAVSLANDQLIPVHVGLDGSMVLTATSERNSLLSRISGADHGASALLDAACPDEVITGWLSAPFWSVAESGDQSTPWQREHTVSAGPLGAFRVDLTMTPVKPDGALLPISISGEGRFVPLVLPQKSHAGIPEILKSVSGKVGQVSGRIQLHRPAEDKVPAEFGPDLESLTFTMVISGEGQSAAIGELPSRAVRFRQTQTQSWVLTERRQGPIEVERIPGLPKLIEPPR